uniref:Transcription factor TFIIB cyclin-like domain-containing protein n=1 Tax=Chromera velia CCMP2878 TaxID=1169474 RepID=A0A0G4HD09_9ALVE|mmetsp:Transcript_12948/g.25312  ORF Transcript_12948/g.25312 Transcript_12948/m.25312 type:complete len:350 (+) Transcript_12948:176-1225(+)|eukprot:Cvel_26346.t1-p1 / transcript=Cvel_26346.t1 / gene=Cvel_26346 / organism=Chromera_velia_CCMP2878 / gene_product=hypothetical protein / transcript_product=hypothetical protein / location=Cvel_scaffold3119:16106-17152(-) / protein_length=349 / sequence_SO=supercontig / SO=protein_coding / is_pseudo=false
MFAQVNFTKGGDTICPVHQDTSCVVRTPQADEVCRKTGMVLRERCEAEDRFQGAPSDDRVDTQTDLFGRFSTVTSISTNNPALARLHALATAPALAEQVLDATLNDFVRTARSAVRTVTDPVLERGRGILEWMSENGGLQKRRSTAHLLAVLYQAAYEESGAFQPLDVLLRPHPSISADELKSAIRLIRKGIQDRPFGKVQKSLAAELAHSVLKRLNIEPKEALYEVITDACEIAEEELARAVRPSTIVASVIWLAVQLCGRPLKLKDIKEVAQAGDAAVRTAVKELSPKVRRIFTEEFLQGGKPAVLARLEGQERALPVMGGAPAESALTRLPYLPLEDAQGDAVMQG